MRSAVLRKIIAVSMAAAMVTGTALYVPAVSEFAGTSITVSAAETYGDFEYTVSDDNTVTVTKYNGTNAKVTVPEKINSKTVTAIGKSAFEKNMVITNVTLPKTIKSIGYAAFIGCSNLTGLNIPDSVETIGSYALRDCSKLTSFHYPINLKSVGDDVLQNTSVKTVTIPEEVTEIVKNAFKSANMLEKVVFPDTVTKIGCGAFYGCTKLTSITLPDAVETIGSYAFAYSGLTSFTLPKKIKSMGEDIFYNVPAKTIKVKEGVTDLPSNAFKGANKLEGVVLPTTLKTIGYSAFYNCSALKSVTLPEYMESIGSYAFCDCSALTKVIVNDSLKSIGECAFVSCVALSEIEIPDTVTSIGTSAFSGCKKLTSFNYPKKLTSVGYNVLENVPVKTITVKSSVTELPRNAFHGANLLEKVVLPGKLQSIGENAFSGCSSLTSVNVPDTVTSVGSYAFKDCVKLTAINYPKSLTSCGYSVFEGAGIKTITVKDGVTALPKNAFHEATNLEKVVLPANLQKISENAFNGCTSLTSVNVPDTVTSIDSYAFMDCEKLTSINYPKSITYSGYRVFEGAGIKTLTVKEGITTLPKYAFQCAKNIEKIVLPSTLKEIGEYAFEDCYSLTSVNIPDSVETIGHRAFQNAKSLTYINYPKNLSWIGSSVFVNVPLVCVTVKEGVTALPERAFDGANLVEKISLPTTLKTIGNYAFNGCKSLQILRVGAKLEKIGSAFVFTNCDNLTIYGTANTYASNYAAQNNIPFVSEYSNISVMAPRDSVNDTQNFMIMADASGGKESYTYAVYYKLTSDEKWTTLQGFKSNTQITFNPPYMGDYDVCVKSKDASGAVKPKYFTVSAERILKNKSTLSDKVILAGESFTVNAKATGGYGGYKYAVLYKKSADSSWVTKQDYSTNSTLTIKPAGTGTYNVCVKVKDADGDIVKTTLNIKVNKPLANDSTISSEAIYLGDTLTLNAKASGGIGTYTYAFLYKKVSDTKWTTKQDFKANAKVDIKPASATDYNFCVKVKDERGTVEKKFFNVKVTSEPLTVNGSISADTIKLGETVTVKGSATGGKSPYTYSFLYKKNADTKWTVKQDFNSNSTVSIKPAFATGYDICVKVKDASGKVEKKFFKLTVTKPLANTSTISSTSIKKGSTVTLNGSATGGAGSYTYAVLYKKKADTKWTVKQDYSTNAKVSVKPYMATDYDICIKVKDKDGTIVKKFFAVKVSAT